MKNKEPLIVVVSAFVVVLILVGASQIQKKNHQIADLQAKYDSRESELVNKLAEQKILLDKKEPVVGKSTSSATDSNACIKKAQEKVLGTFMNICAMQSSEEDTQNNCYTATFDDFAEYAQYSMTIAPTGQTARLWESYEADYKKCK